MDGWRLFEGLCVFYGPARDPPPIPTPSIPPTPSFSFIQVVAYTTSSLHVEMLRIFCDVRCRLPNVVVGFITRASVRRAMASGALRVF